MQDILVRELGGVSIDYAARVSESPWAVVHFTVRLPESSRPQDIERRSRTSRRIQNLLTEAARTWGDRLIGAVKTGSIDQAKAEHYATAFPEVYKQAVPPLDAINDIAIIEELQDNSVKLVLSDSDEDGIAQLTWYLGGHSASLSELLPMLQSHGRGGARGAAVHRDPARRAAGVDLPVQDLTAPVHPRGAAGGPNATPPRALRRRGDRHLARPRRDRSVQRTRAARRSHLAAGGGSTQLREVSAAGGFSVQPVPYRDRDQRQRRHRTVAGRALRGAVLSDAPTDDAPRRRDAQAAAAAVAADIDALVSLDTDRVLRAFASMIQATLRTNYFVTAPDSARAQNVLSFKLNPGLIDELPLPRPRFEIFVYSPRVEGVHLRFGHVARGGLRWSDRKEDFRTEVLGLVKAQAVKNAVIVPVGAKGGFVVKNPPLPTGDAAADRDAQRNEGVACYRLFISGLLDVTDNVDKATGAVVHTARRGSARRRRRLPGGRRRQGHRDVLRHRQRGRPVLRLLARRCVRVGRIGRLRPQGDGHHRQGCVGIRQTALPRDGGRHPVRGLHRRRRRRHERRRVRQRDAAVQAHSAARRVRPPAHLHRPRSGRRDVVGRAQAAVRPAAVQLGGLRHAR